MKSKNIKPTTARGRAQQRVDRIKGFYSHLVVYLLVNTVLLLGKNDFSFILVNNSVFDDANFLTWINWNVYGTLIVWGIGLTIHGLSVFVKNPFLGKNWEEKQIAKYLNKEEERNSKY